MTQGAASNFGNLVGAATGNAVDKFGSLLGTAADISGTIGLVVDLVNFMQNALDGDDNPLQTLQTEILAALQQLSAHQTAQDINTRLTNLGNALSGPTSVLQGLKADLSANLSAAEVEERIEKCSQGLDELSDIATPDASGGVWYAPNQDQTYWTDYNPQPEAGADLGYNAQVPGQDPSAPEGNVYTYVLALPAFLQALCIWLTVAEALAPATFLADYGNTVLNPAWQFLNAQHNKIVSQGIVQLSPLPWTPASLLPQMPSGGPLPGGPVGTPDPIWMAPGSGRPAPTPVSWTGSILYNGLTEARLSGAAFGAFAGVAPVFDSPPGESLIGASIEYGAVEVFSGFSEVGTYSVTFGIGNGLLDFTSSDLSAYNKFRIRLLKKTHDVYVGVGLPGVRNAIDVFAGVLGLEPLPSPSPADWSFRELSGIAGGMTSLSAILNFIRTTTPNDIPGNLPAGSFRAALEV